MNVSVSAIRRNEQLALVPTPEPEEIEQVAADDGGCAALIGIAAVHVARGDAQISRRDASTGDIDPILKTRARVGAAVEGDRAQDAAIQDGGILQQAVDHDAAAGGGTRSGRNGEAHQVELHPAGRDRDDVTRGDGDVAGQIIAPAWVIVTALVPPAMAVRASTCVQRLHRRRRWARWSERALGKCGSHRAKEHEEQ